MKKGGGEKIKKLLLAVAGLVMLIMYAVLAVFFIDMGYRAFGGAFVVLALIGGALAAYMITMEEK